MSNRRTWAAFVAVACLITMGGVTNAESADEKYPARAIDVLSPFTPGGSTDLTARITAEFLKKKWGVPVNVVSKTGGAGVPATLDMYKARADGYTMLGDSSSSAAALDIAVKNPPFKLFDRTFVAMHSEAPFVFAVPANSPYQNFHELIADLKRDPGNFEWAGGGFGFHAIAMRQFCKAAGMDVSKTKEVATSGGASSITLVAGGHVKVGGGSPTSALPAVKAGTIRLLAITSAERLSDLPEVPTTKELGYPTIDFRGWHGISGPPNLPRHIVAIWESAVSEMVADPNVIAQMQKISVVPRFLDSRGLREFVERDHQELKGLYGMR